MRRSWTAGVGAMALALTAAVAGAATPTAASPIVFKAASGPARPITTDDLARVRDIDTLSVAPDGRRFAILVRQARPETNDYARAWYAGDVAGGPLRYLGDAGPARLMRKTDGGTPVGDIGGGVGRWSPDGKVFAFVAQDGVGEQAWVVTDDGASPARQITRNASDVRDLRWSADSRTVLFSVGSTRADLAARSAARAREGFRLQEFLQTTYAINPGYPNLPPERPSTIWRVGLDGTGERLADAAEQGVFSGEGGTSGALGAAFDPDKYTAVLRPPLLRADGAAAWLERLDPNSTSRVQFGRLAASFGDGRKVVCQDPRCAGYVFRGIWWNGDEVVLSAVDGPTDAYYSLYVWAPKTGRVRTIVNSPEHMLIECEPAPGKLICIRETPLRPRHIAVYDLKTGRMEIAADVNPEFAGFRFGRVERIEWETPKAALPLGYSPRAGAFIIYPPDYDPKRKYPTFVAPYSTRGFLRGDFGDEHPLLVYAANGFVVINSGFPLPLRADLGDSVTATRKLYDPTKGYPHLRTLVDSTLRGLDLAATHASIDPARVGMGGVSHGAFIPFYVVQWHDRVSALSTAGGPWHDILYYFGPLAEPWAATPYQRFPKDPGFWSPIDLAQNLETIEAPALFNIAATEVITTGHLIRQMVDAHLPVEAYTFPEETHAKWQPAHRMTIYDRNLDWFRFWLQDVEDPHPAKAAQYERWRKLRELQCKNPKSLRDYCKVMSLTAPVAR